MRKIFLIALTATALTACSEHYDDAKYASKPPQFVEMTFQNIDNPDGGITAGSRIVVTAVQGQYGRLLNGTTYNWTAEPSDNTTHQFTKSVVYDNQPQNPTDTIVFSGAGLYDVTLSATYKSSGNNQSYSGTQQFSGGAQLSSTSGVSSTDITKVTYATNGLLSYSVSVERKIRVLKAGQ